MKKDATDFENAKNDLRKLEDEFGAKNKGDFEDKIGSTKKDTDNFEADMKTDLDRLKELQRQELLLQQKNNADGVVDGFTKRDQELKDKLAKLDGDLTRKRNFNDTEFADPDYDSSSVKKMKDAQDKYFKAKEGSEKLENDFDVNNKNLDSKSRSAEVNSKIDEAVATQKNDAKTVQNQIDELDGLNRNLEAKDQFNKQNTEYENRKAELTNNDKKLKQEKNNIESEIDAKRKRLAGVDDEINAKNKELQDLQDEINKIEKEAGKPRDSEGKPVTKWIYRYIGSDRLTQIRKEIATDPTFVNVRKTKGKLEKNQAAQRPRGQITQEDFKDPALNCANCPINRYKDALPPSLKKEFEEVQARIRSKPYGYDFTTGNETTYGGTKLSPILRAQELFAISKENYNSLGIRTFDIDPASKNRLADLQNKKNSIQKQQNELIGKKDNSNLGELEEKLKNIQQKIQDNDTDIAGLKKPNDPLPGKSIDDLSNDKNKLANNIKEKLDGNKWGNDSFGSKADYKFDPDNPLATKNKISDDINGYDGVAKKTKDDYNNSFKDKEAARADFAKARQELKDNIKNKITQNNKDLDKFRNGSNVDGLDPTLDLDKINAQKKAIADRVKKRIDDNKVGVDGKKADLVFDENNIGKLEQDVKSNVNKRKADLDEKLSNYNNLENTKKRTQKDYNSARDKLKAEYQKRLSDLDDQTNKLDLDNTQADLLAQKQKLQDRLNNDVNPELSKIDLEEIKGRIARNNPDDPNFKADLDDDALSSNLGRKNNTDKDFFENLKKDNADLFKDDNFDMNRVTSNVEKPDFELTGKIKDLIDNKKAELDKLAKEKTDIDPEIDRLSNLKDKDTTDIDKKIAYFDKKLKDGDFWDGQKRLANIDDDYMYFKKGTGEDDGRIGRGLERFNKGKIWDVSPDDGVIKRTLKNVGNELLGLNFLNRAKRALKTNPEDGFIKRGFKLVGRELLFGMVNYKKLFKDKDQQRGVAGVREEQEVVQTEQVPLVDCNVTPNDPSCGSKDICTTNPESKECICSRNPEDTVCLADTNDDQGQEEPEDPVVENKEPECSRCLLLDDEIERLKREIRTNRSLSREEKAAKGERIRSLVKKRNELWQQALEESRNNNNPDSVYKSNIQKADEMIAKLERLIKKKEELRDKFLKTFPGYRLYNKISQNISLMQSINTVERVNSMEDVIFADIEKRDLMSGKIKSPSIDHYQFMKEGKFFVKQNDNLGIVNKALSYSRALPEVAVDIVFPKSHAFIDKLISPFMDQWEAEQGREWEDSSDDRSFDDMMAEEKGKMVVTTAATIGTTMLLKMLVTKIPVAKGVRAGLSTSPGILFLEAMETTVAGLNLSHAAIEYQALKENADKLEGLMDRYDEIGGNKGSGDDSSGGSGTQTSTLYINQAATGALGAAGDVNRSGIKNVNCYSSKAGQAVMDATCGCKASNSCHQVDMSSVLNTPMANNRIDAQQVAALQKRMNEYLQGSSSVQNGNIESVSGNLKLATHFKRKADRMIRAMNKAAQKQGAKAPDTSLGKQLGFMDQILNKTMPPNWGNAWKGGGGNVAETRPPLDLPKEAKEINSNVQQVVASPSSSARSSASVKPGATKPKFDFELAGTADDKVNYMDKKWNISDNAALNKNQINNRKSTSIWTVISHRYRKTGVKVLFEESTQAK